MRKLALVSLAAAAAALPAVAEAQPRAGHSWNQPGQRVIVRHGGQNMGMPGAHQRRDFRHIRRIGRGHFVPQFWWGPQFHVQHWQMYGFPQPMPGHRWVRYYDDAYMIDDRGRVRDSRHDMDWDRYGDRWSYDDRGIPAYMDDEDYDRDDRGHGGGHRGHGDRGHGGGWDYSEYGRGDGPGCAPRRRAPCGPPPHPGPAYGYGHSGYGQAAYGYGTVCCVTITETVVETGGASYVTEVIEEEVVRHRQRRVHRRPPPRRPVRGERG